LQENKFLLTAQISVELLPRYLQTLTRVTKSFTN